MTAPKTSEVGERRGSASPTSGHHLTEEHWQAACAAVTTGGTEADVVRRVASAIADAEDRVRFGSAWCPDCGVHVDNGPHADDCPNQQGDDR